VPLSLQEEVSHYGHLLHPAGDAALNRGFFPWSATRELNLLCNCRSADGEGAFCLLPEVASLQPSLSWE